MFNDDIYSYNNFTPNLQYYFEFDIKSEISKANSKFKPGVFSYIIY